jgi:hypothetical protein
MGQNGRQREQRQSRRSGRVGAPDFDRFRDLSVIKPNDPFIRGSPRSRNFVACKLLNMEQKARSRINGAGQAFFAHAPSTRRQFPPADHHSGEIPLKKLLIGAFALSLAGAFAPGAASAATVTKVIVKHPHPHCRTVRTTVWRHHHKVVTVKKVCR